MLFLACMLLSACSGFLRSIETSVDQLDANAHYAFVEKRLVWPWQNQLPYSVGSGRRLAGTTVPLSALPDPSSNGAEFHPVAMVKAGVVRVRVELEGGHMCMPENTQFMQNALSKQSWQMQEPHLWLSPAQEYDVRLKVIAIPEFSHRMPVKRGQPLEFYVFLDDCHPAVMGEVVYDQISFVFHELAHLEHYQYERRSGRTRPGLNLPPEFVGIGSGRLFRELVAELADLCSLHRIRSSWADSLFDERMQLVGESDDLVQRYTARLQKKGALDSYLNNPRRFNRSLLAAGVLAELLSLDLKNQMIEAESSANGAGLPACETLLQSEGFQAVADWLEHRLGS